MSKENTQVIKVRTSWKKIIEIKIRDPKPDEFVLKPKQDSKTQTAS